MKIVSTRRSYGTNGRAVYIRATHRLLRWSKESAELNDIFTPLVFFFKSAST